MKSNLVQTQIQYKMIEELTRANEELSQEIVNRKLKENELEKLLKEKEILLREVNHRVKNNLQIIQGMISLKLDLNESKEVETILIGFKNRLNSISILHSLLQNNGSLEYLSLKEYLSEILRYTLNDKVIIEIDSSNTDIYFEQASSIGMVIHELATNSLKHAWNNDRDYKKVVSLKINEVDKKLNMVYQDNGNNTVSPKDLENSFGNNIIDVILSDETDNNREYDFTNSGLKFSFNFSIK